MMRRAVIIGSNGPADAKQLKFAESDAVRLTKTLSSMGCGFNVEKAIGLKSAAARTRFLRACEACVSGDTFVAYFAGHGLINEGDLFFLFSNTDYSRLMETCLRGDEVLTALRRCKASNRLLILDCCNAGQITSKTGMRSGQSDRILMKDLGFVSDIFEIILASDALEAAREFPFLGGGFLSTALIEALTDSRVEADADRDGAISVQDMESWLHGAAVNYNNLISERKDKVPLPRRVGVGHGITYLSRPPSDWIYYEVPMPDGIPGVVLPIRHYDGTHAYIIGKYPVTIDAFRRSRGALPPPTARRFDGRQWEEKTFNVFDDPEFGQPGKPMVGVTLRDVLHHCKWLSKKAGASIENVAPPTAALWETALFGDARHREHREWLRAQAVIHSQALSTAVCEGQTGRTSKLGIVDLIGNIWEWVINDYDWEWFQREQRPVMEKRAASVPPQMRPIDYSRLRAWLKGGSFYDKIEQIDLTADAEDIFEGPESRHADIGFRWSATVQIGRLPKEVREAVDGCSPLPRRIVPVLT